MRNLEQPPRLSRLYVRCANQAINMVIGTGISACVIEFCIMGIAAPGSNNSRQVTKNYCVLRVCLCILQEFLVGAKASHVHFLKSKFAVVCERGFEIIDPNNLSCSHSIPNVDDPNFNFLQTRADGLRPLAMYRVHNKFLLCYNKFTFFVNNNTQALMPRDAKSAYLCEWETNPDHIVYRHPYIIAIEQRFIEIRHVETVSYYDFTFIWLLSS